MLVQFSCKNVLSFKEEAVLDMTAIPSYKEHPDNLITGVGKEKYLHVAAVYGANASGKSNLYLAMSYFQDIVRYSMNSVRQGEASYIDARYYPFSFDEDQNNSEYQIVTMDDEFEYRYGFEYNASRIEAEWLYRTNLKTKRQATVLERTGDEVVFGASVRRELNRFKDQIPPDALVLSFITKLPKLETKVFTEVYDGIMDTLVVPSTVTEDPKMLYDFLPRIIDQEKSVLLRFLRAIDVGISDIMYDDSEKEVLFFTFHIGKDGTSYPLNLFSESEGTIKSIILYIYARLAVKNDRSMFVDELNSKLHPLLLKFIIDQFYIEESKAQLVYTTHDTTLLDKKFMRRDQVWFVQKDQFGCSELVALSDFKVRSDASFEKDYLAGIYGGIPRLDEYSLIGGE